MTAAEGLIALGAAPAGGLLVYLVYALLRAEEF
jgi:K+-transporting ATPase KdpF subunit